MATNFPELTDNENAIIDEARDHGYAVFFPAISSAQQQAIRTLRGAIDHLYRLPAEKALNSAIDRELSRDTPAAVRCLASNLIAWSAAAGAAESAIKIDGVGVVVVRPEPVA